MIRALALALAALALLPAAASAHALLEATTPNRGERLDAAPEQVSLRFSEPVEAEFGAVRVFDSDGREVQAGRTFHPGDRAAEVAVRLRPGLGEDGYTVTYRVISADSHPVSGGFVFVVGDAPAPSTTVGDLLGDDDTGPVTGTAFGVARAVQFGAIAVGLGSVIFALLCWLPGLRATAGAGAGWEAASTAFSARLRSLLLASAAAGAISAAVAIVLQGAVAGGTGVGPALSADVIGDVLGTRFGVVWALGLLAWLVVGLLAAAPRPVPVLQPASVGATGLALPPTTRLAVLAVPLAALSALPALGGHASVQSPVALLTTANVLHVTAMSAWLGGVAVLVLVLRAATARLEVGDRTRLLAAVVARFSTPRRRGDRRAARLGDRAGSGRGAHGAEPGGDGVRARRARQDRALLRHRRARGDQPPAPAAGAGARGARGRVTGTRRIAATPHSAGRTGARRCRAGGDRGAGRLRPSVAEGQGPFAGSADIGPARLELTVDPARTGPNEMHVYLFDRADGSQYDETKELTVTAELPEKRIEPIEFEATKAGPGHYVVSGAALGVEGDWTVEIAARVSDFDEFRTKLEVPVR